MMGNVKQNMRVKENVKMMIDRKVVTIFSFGPEHGQRDIMRTMMSEHLLGQFEPRVYLVMGLSIGEGQSIIIG